MPDDQASLPPAYAVTDRSKVKRKHHRGHYDAPTVHGILDSAMMCHIAYVIDGQPYCTPTGFWREGGHLYWHGSSASRMIRNQSAGQPVCLTVTHMDAIVLARCGFNHSINYRSVMAYGNASIIADPVEKNRAMDAFIDRFFPGRSREIRQPTPQEFKATTLVGMAIEEASAKIRAMPVTDDEEDYAVPAWTALFPVTTVIGEAVECPRQIAGLDRPPGLAGYTPGRRADEIFTEAYRLHYGAME